MGKKGRNDNDQIKVASYLEKENSASTKILVTKDPLQMKHHISKLSLDIVSKSSDQTRKLKELYSILEDKDHGKSIILRKSVIVSLCLIYKDILPSYKISILTDEQKDQSMKKETVKIFSEEELLLAHYQKYIKIVKSVILKKNDIEELKFIKWTDTDRLTMLKCASELYLCRPNFNLSQTLLKLIVPFLNSTDKNMLAAATSAIRRAISDDIRGDVRLKICEEIKLIATKARFVFRSTLLKPLMDIDLEDLSLLEEESDNLNKRKTFSRKQKKNFKKNKKKIEEKAETSAKESLDSKYKYNSLILRTMFYTYFQVLKQKAVSSKLLGVVLDSIQKFGRLIDVKMFPDSFKILSALCDNKKISTENRLRSVYVAICILTSGKASEILEIDPIHFCQKLLSIGEMDNLSEASVLLVINSCTKILMKRRNHNAIKDVEKLIRMFIGLAWNLRTTTPLSALVLLSVVRYMRVYPRLQFMFDEDDNEMPDEFRQKLEVVPKTNDVVPIGDNKTLAVLQSLGAMSCYEVAGVAKRIKKFFRHSEAENSLLGLKASLEELTKMTTDECLETLKARCMKPTKRPAGGDGAAVAPKRAREDSQ